MINVRTSGINTPHAGEARVQHRGTQGFWLLFALEALFVAGALALVLVLVLPSRAQPGSEVRAEAICSSDSRGMIVNTLPAALG